MIEVQLRPEVPGCLTLLLAGLSLGLVPILMRWNERHFARRMDEDGVTTRGGRRIAWSEVTAIRRAQGIVRPGRRVLEVRYTDDLYTRASRVTSDEYLLESPKGRVSVPFWRAANGEALRAFTLEHVPAHLLPPRPPSLA